MQKQKVADGPRFLSSAYHALCKTGVPLFLGKNTLGRVKFWAAPSDRKSSFINFDKQKTCLDFRAREREQKDDYVRVMLSAKRKCSRAF
jgi:hypothetical protein